MVTQQTVAKVRQMWAQKKTHQEIQEATGLSSATEYAISVCSEDLTDDLCAARAAQITEGMEPKQIRAIMKGITVK